MIVVYIEEFWCHRMRGHIYTYILPTHILYPYVEKHEFFLCCLFQKKSLWIQRRRLRSYFFFEHDSFKAQKLNSFFFESERLSYLSDQNETKTLNPFSWVVIARTQETDLRREEIRLREESLEDGIRFPRGEGLVIHNIVQMLLLMVVVETRIDIDHTIREDAVADTIEE